jgi:monoterpene epsilon-lactone hydrolase
LPDDHMKILKTAFQELVDMPEGSATPDEWNGTGGQPSRLYAASIYYIFNAAIWFLCAIGGLSKREAVSAIFNTCKRFQRKSLTAIRQPVLALISPASAAIQYTCQSAGGAGGPFVYTVKPALQKSITLPEMLYIHGGGCISGDFAGYKGFCERLANELGVRVHFVAYRLAPEADICDAATDVLLAHKRISSNAAAAPNWMADSGGAVIALNAMSRLLSKQGPSGHPFAPPVPSKCILLSPVTDLTCSGKSFRKNAAADAMLDVDVMRWVLWLASRDSSKDQSPIVQNFSSSNSGKPSFYIYVGAKEILLEDSIRMANKLGENGYTVNLEVNPWGFHSWPLLWKYVPEADQTVRDICATLSAQI